MTRLWQLRNGGKRKFPEIVFSSWPLSLLYKYKHTPRIKIIEELKIHNITRMGHIRVQRLIDTCIYEILKSISQNKSLRNLSDTHVRNVGSTYFTHIHFNYLILIVDWIIHPIIIHYKNSNSCIFLTIPYTFSGPNLTETAWIAIPSRSKQTFNATRPEFCQHIEFRGVLYDKRIKKQKKHNYSLLL